MFYYGVGQGQTVFGNGYRCATAGGLGQWIHGDEWNVQAWYRTREACGHRSTR